MIKSMSSGTFCIAFLDLAASGIPGIAMEHYKALYSAVAPYLGSLAT